MLALFRFRINLLIWNFRVWLVVLFYFQGAAAINSAENAHKNNVAFSRGFLNITPRYCVVNEFLQKIFIKKTPENKAFRAFFITVFQTTIYGIFCRGNTQFTVRQRTGSEE